MSTELRILVAGEWMKQEEVVAELVYLRAKLAACEKERDEAEESRKVFRDQSRENNAAKIETECRLARALDRVKELEGQLDEAKNLGQKLDDELSTAQGRAAIDAARAGGGKTPTNL